MAASKVKLSPDVIFEVERLGGQPGGKTFNIEEEYDIQIIDGVPTLEGEPVDIPLAVEEIYSIAWPDYEKVNYHGEAEGGFFWARGVIFHSFQYLDNGDWGFKDRNGKVLVAIANARESKNTIMIDLRDPNPADPTVYHVASGYNPVLGTGVPLSVFLKNLTRRA